MQTTKQLNRQYLWAALALLFTIITIFSFAQKRTEAPVKVKIVKIVDGDTSVTEQSMEESKIEDFTQQFNNTKGKNVQVMVTVEGDEKGRNGKKNSNKNSSTSAMRFNFDMDSATAKAISKCFMFSDSALRKKFVWHDSLMKGLPKDFNFNFNFDHEEIMKGFDFDFKMDTKEDDKTVIIRKNGGNTIVINGDEDNISINSDSNSEEGKSKTQTKTIVINDDKTKTKKKVIVTTSVVVIDMDDDKGSERKLKEKEADNFSFYPNPSDGNFTLDLDLNPVGNPSNGVNGKEAVAVRIVDMSGKEVYNEKISGNGSVSKSINLDGKKGTFIVTVKQGKRTSSKKIIIE